ncbi:hypothetical protein HQ571_01285 [Candidatus Kuenenbacteria bacterium]|nr:hypothetical protein [Candidatus Kuenenbacteria bacterium]
MKVKTKVLVGNSFYALAILLLFAFSAVEALGGLTALIGVAALALCFGTIAIVVKSNVQWSLYKSLTFENGNGG